MPKPTISGDSNVSLFQKAVDAIKLVEYYGDELIAKAGGGGGVLAGAQRASAEYEADTNGVQTLLGSSPVARVVVLKVTVTEAFTDGSGGQPTFSFGETGAATKFGATSVLDGAALGQVFTLAGTLDAGDSLIVTAVQATGTGTGAISVEAAATPAEV